MCVSHLKVFGQFLASAFSFLFVRRGWRGGRRERVARERERERGKSNRYPLNEEANPCAERLTDAPTDRKRGRGGEKKRERRQLR